MERRVISEEIEETILKIIKKGNSVEIKRERGNLVLVEIQRKVRNKTAL